MHSNIYKTDLELALACSEGDRNAQRILFERVKNPMFGVCLRFTESRTAAEDLLQEGFIKMFRDIGKYRGEGSLDGWVRRIFVRAAIEDFHKKQKEPKLTDLDDLEDIIANYDIADQNDPTSVIVLLQQLPPGFRAVINLAVLEEKSHEEIGRELGISASTSRSQLTRAKVFLKKIIQKTLLFI